MKGTINIVKAMTETNCKKIIFSSTAAVYDADIAKPPFAEDSIIRPQSVYGETKMVCEKIIKDACDINVIRGISLRYFNPAGCSKEMGTEEKKKGKTQSLFNAISISTEAKKTLKIYGKDWETRDGTAIRDYIHVVDLADAHIKAIDYVNRLENNHIAINLGSGTGHTVLEIVRGFEKISGKKINYIFEKRRPGDVGISLANCDLAKKTIKWQNKKTLLDLCTDHLDGARELLQKKGLQINRIIQVNHKKEIRGKLQKRV